MTGRASQLRPEPAPAEGGSPGATDASSRSFAYALFSRLLASPWEETDRRACLPPPDLDRILDELGSTLPFAAYLDPLRAAAAALIASAGSRSAAARALAGAYGGLFEVGSGGPPVPLREASLDSRSESTREEVVRYYDYFGYRLRGEREWQPDHLSVELEFLHFLAFRESAAAVCSRGLRLGQLDFLERHPLSWVPELVERLAGAEVNGAVDEVPRRYYAALLRALAGFLTEDAAWQREALGRGA